MTAFQSRDSSEVVSTRAAAQVRRDLAGLTRHDVPTVRSVRRRYSKLLKNEAGPIVVEFAIGFATTGDWPELLIGCEVIASHPAAAAALDEKQILEMAKGLADWGTVDLFGVTILGPAWRDRRVSDATMQRLVRSPDRWQRRLALVATVPLNSLARGGKASGDPRRTLRICRQLVADRDDMVVKALSWALRELAKRDRAAVEEFVTKHNAQLAPRVRREVSNKLRTGLKTPRRRST